MLWILTQDKKDSVNVKEVKCTGSGNTIVCTLGKMSFDVWSSFLGMYE